MFGNIKSITLQDGRKIDLTTRVGEFFEVQIDKDFVEMVHQEAFFRDHVKAPELLDMLLEKEEAHKRSEAGRKAAETRKKNKAKKRSQKEDPKEEEDSDQAAEVEVAPDDSDNSKLELDEGEGTKDIAEAMSSIEETLDQAEPEQSEEIETVSFEEVEEPEQEEDVEPEQAEEIQASPEEAFGEPEAQEQEVVIEWENKKAEAAFNLFKTAGVSGSLLFGGKALFMMNNTDGFAEKMGIETGANKDETFQIGTASNEALVYQELKTKELKKKDFDLIVASPPMPVLFSAAIDLVKSLKPDAVLYLMYPVSKANEKEPKYTEYQELIDKLNTTILKDDSGTLIVEEIINTKV